MKRAVCLLLFLPVLSQAVWGQGLSSTTSDFDRLEQLLEAIQQSNNEQQKQLEVLSGKLKNSEEASKAQEESLRTLKQSLSEQQELFDRQLTLSAGYERKWKNWRLAFILGVPLAAGAGALAGMLIRR